MSTIGSSVKTPSSTGGAKKSSSVSRTSSGKAAPKKQQSTVSKGSQDKAKVSGDAKKADKPNAMAEGITKNWKEKGLETSDGNKLGKYTKGGEGTIEKELLKKGFTLKDIYTKDKQGRTLAEQVAQTNGVKDMKKIADGKELKLPQRPGAQGVSSGEVKPGEKKTVETVNGANKAEQTIAKDKDGGLNVNQTTKAGGNEVSVDTKTGPGGTSTGSTARDGKEVVNNNVTQSADNKAITETTQRTNNGDVQTQVRDADGVQNSTAQRTEDGLKVSNPDGGKGGVDTTIPLGPQGIGQRIANTVDRAAEYVAPSLVQSQKVTGGETPVNGVGSVQGVQRPDGSADYTVRQGNGQTSQVGQTADGPVLGAYKAVEHTVGEAYEGVKNTVGEAYEGAKTGIGNAYEGAKTGIGNAYDGAVGGIKSGWNWLTGG